MDRRFAFLSGLPRTGSTVLCSLLSRHPELHTTGTSMVLDLMRSPGRYALGESFVFDLQDQASPAYGIMRGILRGAYERVDEGKIVLEKDRGWAAEIPRLFTVLGDKPKVIATVRPVPEIISSFILLSKRIGGSNKIDDEVLSLNRELDDKNRARVIWDKYVYNDWKNFKIGWESHKDCFCLVDYSEVVQTPQVVVDRVCAFLGIEKVDLETSDLSNPNPENDAVYGLPGLHHVRKDLKRISPPAEEVLGEELYQFWTGKNLNFWT